MREKVARRVPRELLCDRVAKGILDQRRVVRVDQHKAGGGSKVLGRAGGCLAHFSCVAIAEHSSDTRSLAESMRAKVERGAAVCCAAVPNPLMRARATVGRVEALNLHSSARSNAILGIQFSLLVGRVESTPSNGCATFGLACAECSARKICLF